MGSSCPTCGKTFRRAATVTLHLQQSTHDAFKCPSCPFHFVDESSLAAHYGSMHRVGSVYSCLWCTDLFSKEKLLSKHLKSTHSIQPQIPWAQPQATEPGTLGKSTRQCHLCLMYFTSAETIARHYSRIHYDPEVIEQEMHGRLVQEETFSSSDISIPVTAFHSESLSWRELLQVSFAGTSESVPEPTIQPTADLTVDHRFDLERCGKCSMMIPDVELHYITKHPELYCRACTSVFKTKANAEAHYRDTRGHNACSLCNVSFGTTESYRGHMTTDHIQKLAVAQCITCDKYYKTDATLFAHIAAAHDSEGGDLNALSRPLRYTGHIKAKRTSLPTIKFGRNQANTSSSRATDAAGVGSGRQSAKKPVEKANPDEVSGVEDKDIPPTRGTPIVLSSDEEYLLSDASSVFSCNPRASESVDLTEDGRRRAGVPSAQGREAVEQNTSYASSLEKASEEGNPIVEADVSRVSSALPASVPTNVDPLHSSEHKSSQESEPVSPPRNHYSASVDTASPNDTFECSRATAASFACKVCEKMPAEPTLMICGHLFCHGCIMAELSKNLCCPACGRIMFVRINA